jgi:hypothetical protein
VHHRHDRLRPAALLPERDFDNGCPPAGWTLGGDWQCGTPTAVGPASAYSAPACLGTIINGNYNNNQSWTTAVVTSPPINLMAATQPTLRMRSWVYTEGSIFDGYNLKVSTNNGANWALIANVTPAYNLSSVDGEVAWGGNQSAQGWQEVTADLSAYVGQTILLRVAFRTDGSVTYPGIYVDDMLVSEPGAIPLVITTSTLSAAAVNQAYSAQLQKTGGTVNSVWSITGGMNHAWLSIDPSTGLLTGTPTINEVGPVTLTVHVEEPAQPSNFADKTFNFSVNQIVYQTSFESCPDGWALTGEWQCGTPTVVGPASAFDGVNCLNDHQWQLQQQPGSGADDGAATRHGLVCGASFRVVQTDMDDKEPQSQRQRRRLDARERRAGLCPTVGESAGDVSAGWQT